MTFYRSAVCWAALALLGGCAGSELKSRVVVLEAVVKKAWDNGAYKCAPSELAMAEAHTAFAARELDQGDYYRARQELAVADANAKAAIRKSPKDKCNPELVVAPPEPKKQIVVQRVDTDSDGLFDDEDACPKEPEDKDGFQDEDGCPEPDNDNDGIMDVDDQCPLKAEDIDQFEDKDGCPEPDNDKDGLADGIDKCPNEAEDSDNFEDDDGCPDADNDHDKVVDYPTPDDKCPNEFAETPDGCPQKYQLIVVTAERIELKQTIYFDYRKATIKPVSYPLLNEVAHALTDHAGIVVRIEGHTDSRGSDKFNLKLSQARSASVRQYLIGRGILAARMDAKGYGETVPIADNRTEAGRDQNRRVEFVITKSE